MRAWVEIKWNNDYGFEIRVALHVRAWVEIGLSALVIAMVRVALHVRAWVEIKDPVRDFIDSLSPSM